MPCCLIIIASMIPRIALVVMWLSGYSGSAFKSVLWPVLGFLFMPFTTCAYVIGKIEHGDISGWALALLILGVMLDLGSHGGQVKTRKTFVYARRRR